MTALRRIRWPNAARLAGGVAGIGVLALAAPGLLRAPEPPPLPRDVGLPRAALVASQPLPAASASPSRGDDEARGHHVPTDGGHTDEGREPNRRPPHPATRPGVSHNAPSPAPPTPLVAAPPPPPARAPPPPAAPASTPTPPQPPAQPAGPPEVGFEH